MKKIIYIFILFNNIYADNIITFFLKASPEVKSDQLENHIKKIAENPDKAHKYAIKRELWDSHIYSGVYALLHGDLTYSDLNGQIIFHREGILDTINILVTPDIRPVLVNPKNKATISGFIITPNANFRIFRYVRKIDNDGKNFWSVTEFTDQVDPQKINKIDRNTIVLAANPDGVNIPTGNFPAIGGENFILPDIVMLPNFKKAVSAFKIFKRRQYFNPEKLTYKYPADNVYEYQLN